MSIKEICSSQMDEGTPPEPEGSFVDYQTTMVKFSKAIAITSQEMVSAPMHSEIQTNPNKACPLFIFQFARIIFVFTAGESLFLLVLCLAR